MKSPVKAITVGFTVCAAAAATALPAAANTNRSLPRHHATNHHKVAKPAKHGRYLGGAYSGLPVTRGSAYLALGDSVPFGYQEPQVVPAPNYADASTLANYPDMIAQELHLTVANLACPGETSASFIDTSAESNGCENTLGNTAESYRANYPLHYSYSGSQLSAAVAYLEATPNVRLVSLMIGANDAFICQETTPDNCASVSEELGVAKTLGTNVRTILSAIRNTAHYKGQIVIVNYYSLDYANSTDNLESKLGDAALDLAAAPYHVVDADGYGVFESASADSAQNPCTAGLLTQLGAPGTCGIHPSYAGQALLAQSVLDAITS